MYSVLMAVVLSVPTAGQAPTNEQILAALDRIEKRMAAVELAVSRLDARIGDLEAKAAAAAAKAATPAQLPTAMVCGPNGCQPAAVALQPGAAVYYLQPAAAAPRRVGLLRGLFGGLCGGN